MTPEEPVDDYQQATQFDSQPCSAMNVQSDIGLVRSPARLFPPHGPYYAPEDTEVAVESHNHSESPPTVETQLTLSAVDRRRNEEGRLVVALRWYEQALRNGWVAPQALPEFDYATHARRARSQAIDLPSETIRFNAGMWLQYALRNSWHNWELMGNATPFREATDDAFDRAGRDYRRDGSLSLV